MLQKCAATASKTSGGSAAASAMRSWSRRPWRRPSASRSRRWRVCSRSGGSRGGIGWRLLGRRDPRCRAGRQCKAGTTIGSGSGAAFTRAGAGITSAAAPCDYVAKSLQWLPVGLRLPAERLTRPCPPDAWHAACTRARRRQQNGTGSTSRLRHHSPFTAVSFQSPARTTLPQLLQGRSPVPFRLPNP